MARMGTQICQDEDSKGNFATSPENYKDSYKYAWQNVAIVMKVASDSIQNQSGPCGIICSTCPLGSGTVAESAGLTKQSIKDCKIPEWSPFVPGGKEIDWAIVDKGLEWMTKYACCAGCENGGGPPDCTIRICAKERGYELCSQCSELDSCTNFDWLKDNGPQMKMALKENIGRSKEEYIKVMAGKMPWNSR